MKTVKLYGYENTHTISECGVVTRYYKNGKSRIMKSYIDTKGYQFISIGLNGVNKAHRIHRLKMLSFNFINNYMELDVNHKDGNKINNNLDNLEWCTRSENIKHAFSVLGRKAHTKGKYGKLHHSSIPIVGIDKNGNIVCEYESINLSRNDGYSIGHISQCLYGKRKTHKKLKWYRKEIDNE